MISRYSIEAAYSFFHQKGRIYAASNIERQKDDIEFAVAEYVNSMNRDLYEAIASGHRDFLLAHDHFATDIQSAVYSLEKMMEP